MIDKCSFTKSGFTAMYLLCNDHNGFTSWSLSINSKMDLKVDFITNVDMSNHSDQQLVTKFGLNDISDKQ